MLVKYCLIVLFIHSIAFGQVLIPGNLHSQTIHDELLFNPEKGYLKNRSAIYPFDSFKWELIPQETLSTQKLSFFSPEFKTTLNSRYPRGYNDGPLWKGRGITNELHFGISGKIGIFHYSVLPTLFFSQNLSYELAPYQNGNRLNYQFGNRVDWVQQMGSSSGTYINLGQSELRLNIKKFTIAATNQNFTIGPSVQNPIIMSNNGGGIPRIEMGTITPVKLKWKNLNLGEVHGKFFGGLLFESDYYDEVNNNNERYISGLNIEYDIPFIENLTIGGSRVLYKNLLDFQPNDLFSGLIKIDEGGDTLNDFFDQMASVYIDWHLKESNFRFYAEYAKNDFNANNRAIFVDVDHARAYTIGFQKGFVLSTDRKIIILYEHTTLARNDGFLYRAVPPYYKHHIVRHGYTQRGQIIGAGIGPGSNSDIFRINAYDKTSKYGLSLQRISFDQDYFITTYGSVSNAYDLRDIEYTLGLSYNKFWKNWIFGGGMDLSSRLNMYYQYKNDKVNFSPSLFVKYLIR